MHRRRLALFPLPIVLFPGAIVPLHIFEPRYRRMVATCLEFDRRFGLIFHDSDRDGPFLTEPGRVGCVAEIRRYQGLPEGRSLILAEGRDRFVIVDGIESSTPYYEALVDPLEDRQPGRSDLRPRRESSLRLFSDLLDSLDEEPADLEDLDPANEVSFGLARTIGIDPAWQQALLELTDEGHRLDRIDAVFQAALDHGLEESA